MNKILLRIYIVVGALLASTLYLTACSDSDESYARVESVSLSETDISLAVGNGKTLIATIFPENAEDKRVVWNSKNPLIATVDQDGYVQAVSVGSTTITVTTEDGGLKDICNIKVILEHIPVTDITLNEESITLAEGDSRPLLATIFPEDATNKRVLWKSTEPSVAAVDDQGLVTALTIGETIIIASSEDGGKTAVCTVIVEPMDEEISFPDENFHRYILENFDADGDGKMTRSEASIVTEINCRGMKIESLEGIGYFRNLTVLHCSQNNLTSLDLSDNRELTFVSCYLNQLTELNVKGNTKLETLWCYYNSLPQLDVSNNEELIVLNCYDNQLTRLDLRNNLKLKEIDCYNNHLTSLDLSYNKELTHAYCARNEIKTLDLRANTNLQRLSCGSNMLTTLDVTQNLNLIYLNFYLNDITSIDISKNLLLNNFDCSYSKLTGLDISKNTKLTKFNSEKNPSLNRIYVWEGFDTTTPGNSIKEECIYDSHTIFVVKGDNIFDKITDAAFKNYCKDFDLDNDGLLSLEEAEKVTTINCSGRDIKSLAGIEYFANLETLNCKNNQIESLDLFANIYIKDLDCSNNKLTNLSISKNPKLTSLKCSDNQISALDLTALAELTLIDCYNNQLTTMDFSNNPKLETLLCNKNAIESLNIASATKLVTLNCAQNKIKELNVTQNPALVTLTCFSNELTTLNVDNNKNLNQLWCHMNNLTGLDISNNISLTKFNSRVNPDLATIYVWEGFDTENPKASIASCLYDSHTKFVVKM